MVKRLKILLKISKKLLLLRSLRMKLIRFSMMAILRRVLTQFMAPVMKMIAVQTAEGTLKKHLTQIPFVKMLMT